MAVGAVDYYGRKTSFTQTDDYMTTFAPGKHLMRPEGDGSNIVDGFPGTSFVSPIVAGVAAYFRSLDSDWGSQLKTPANVKKMIQLLQRKLVVHEKSTTSRTVPVVWNGQLEGLSCICDHAVANPKNGYPFPAIDSDLDNVTSPGDWAPGGGGGSKGINWGWYCMPNPRCPPPGFKDPKDPNNAGGPNVGAGPGHNTGGGGGGKESSLNWALQMYPDGPFPPDAETGHGGHLTQPCERLPQSFDIRKGSGFTKGDMKIYMYSSTDCSWRSNDDIFRSPAALASTAGPAVAPRPAKGG
ncbi:hypothetical protein ACHAQH_004164 [Verticillium albo-atrum]